MYKNGFYKLIMLILSLLLIIWLNACSPKEKRNSLLDPDRPITVTLWHYYNGSIKEEFDYLVSEFNETMGMEYGIVIESQSYGGVVELETALLDAARKSIGSSPMPDAFASYSDNAYRLSRLISLVPLDKYFSEEEIRSYRAEFMEEGCFLRDQGPYILPVAKSSENLFVNKTDWLPFAAQYGFTNDDLLTWEGIYNVSKKYKEVTGKGFFCIDSNANFMILFSKQFGVDIFSTDDNGKSMLNFTEPLAGKIWDYFYDPFVNGYYAKSGRFCTDDAKTGGIIAFIGSTAGARYFPTEITDSEENIHKIQPLVLPYPCIKGNDPYVIQQGAGMCITETDNAHEYAASIFLKWFTDTDQNIRFAIGSGYLPVKNQAFEDNLLLESLNKTELHNPAIKESFITTNNMLQYFTFYCVKPFLGSYELRALFGNSLFDKVIIDLQILEQRVANGENRNDIISELLSDDEFNKWYNNILNESERILAQFNTAR